MNKTTPPEVLSELLVCDVEYIFPAKPITQEDAEKTTYRHFESIGKEENSPQHLST
jgi:hypothetical protein